MEGAEIKKPFHEEGMVQNLDWTTIVIVQPHILLAFPTRSSFGTAYRERPNGLSHFEQTLNPGVPGLPVRELLWKLPGSGLYVSREPHLPRIRFS